MPANVNTPTALRAVWRAIKGSFLVPLVEIVILIVVLHVAGTFDYKWQWILATWSYPILVVAGGVWLFRVRHWSVQKVARTFIPIVLLVATNAIAYKAGQEDTGGPWAIKLSDVAKAQKEKNGEIAALKTELAAANADRVDLAGQLAAARTASLAVDPALPPAAPVSTPPAKPKSPKLYRKRIADPWELPSFSDLTNSLPKLSLP